MKKSMVLGFLLPLTCTVSYADMLDTLPTPPASVTTNEPSAPATPASNDQPAVINCEYHIPANQKEIDQLLITAWAEQAIVQSFDLDANTIDSQIQKLEPCFTEQGWTSFNEALQQSGNIEAIKSQNLSVSSQVNGKTVINLVKDGQWKVTIPVQVVYQNNKEKSTQQLSVDVLIGRKTSGDLGIMQIIATPKISDQPAAMEPDAQNATPQTSEQANPMPTQ